MMKTLGLDMASQAKETAICWIVWGASHAVASPPLVSCSDARIDEAIATVDVVGVDAPFGWPAPFVEAVADWSSPYWNNALRDSVRLRTTDHEIHQRTGISPLSVSSDRIALPAMRTMALLHRHGVLDRSGDGRFYEVYPAAALKQWGLPCKGYKGSKPGRQDRRVEILAKLKAALPALQAGEEYVNSDHALDALVAALAARAAALGKTLLPTNSQREVAVREGWIHIPQSEPKANFASSLWP